MKSKIFVGLCGVVIFAFCIVATNTNAIKSAYATVSFNNQCQKIIDAINLQCKTKIETGEKQAVNADTKTIINDKILNNQNFNYLKNGNFPSNFDLRNCDLDGSGQRKNYVTSVKFQNPWGSCWAFAGIAASETNILSELRQNSFYIDEQGKHDTIDLSERHLAWFNYSPMLTNETAAQAGEGAYSTTEKEAKEKGQSFWLSQRMATGGVCMSVNSSFSTGMGVAKEPSFNDMSVGEIARQLLYKNNEDKITQTSKGANIYDEEADWSVDYSLRFKHDYNIEDGSILPDANGSADEPYDIDNAEKVTQLMKQELTKGHALDIAFCADNYSPDKHGKYAKYINVDTWAHYTYEKVGANHDVTIVGWDDNFDKSNFLSEVYNPETKKYEKVNQPPKNGAWIVKNSWGALDSWGQGLNINKWGLNNTGYFYISYYDQSLQCEEAYDFDVAGKTDAATIINQHDYMPCEQARGIMQDSPVESCNVFTAQQNQDIVQLGTITSEDNETVTFKLYKLSDKSQQPNEGELLSTATKNFQYKGFHRVYLDGAYRINAGESFAVVKSELAGNKYIFGVSCDVNEEGEKAGKAGDSYYCNGIVNAGESYLKTSDSSSWTDFKDIKNKLEKEGEYATYFTFDNFPIKAYGVPVIDPTPTPVPDNPVNPTEIYESAQTYDHAQSAILAFGFIMVTCIFVLIKKHLKHN